MADVDLVKAELAANPSLYAGLPAHRIVDVMNDPRTVGTETQYRAVNTPEVYDAISAAAKSKLAAAAEDYAVAANEAARAKAAAGVALYERLGIVGSVNVAPGSTGRAELDAAVTAGYVTAAESDALVALGTSEVQVRQTLWQGWGWSHSVTTALVEEALA